MLSQSLAGGSEPQTKKRLIYISGLLAAAALVLRFIVMMKMPLLPEEAYYWMYSQHLALSYFDHPPMVAWAIRLGTWLLGDTELGVRIIGCAMMLGASGAIYRFSRIWFGRSTALFSALAIQILPAYFVMGGLGLTDEALLFFWALGLWLGSVALQCGNWWIWTAFGIACGGAMLSKYTGVFLPLGIFIALWMCADFRKHLRAPGPYVAALAALICFSPVLVWNAQHAWASFWFQGVERFEKAEFGWRFIWRFIFCQVVIGTPFIFIVLPALTRKAWRQSQPRWAIAWAFSMPVLLVMAARCFRYEVHVNWTLPAYLSLIPAGLYWWKAYAWKKFNGERVLTYSLSYGVGICAIINVIGCLFVLNTARGGSALTGIEPWRRVAVFVEKYEDQLEDQTHREPLVVAGGTYRLASELGFYRVPLETLVPSSHYTTSAWFIEGDGLAFQYWTNRNAWHGRDCVYIGEGVVPTRWLTPYFDSVQVVPEVMLLNGANYHLAICKGYHSKAEPLVRSNEMLRGSLPD
jgi:dolichol-phosphate mannosyltransferase